VVGREEVRILEDVSRPVATAVANALAFEEIRALRASVHAIEKRPHV
jgi:GAF domain-containing protein